MSRSEATLVRTFKQEDFNRFAQLSGDDNPIHTDPEFSARTRFGHTVAHGLLLCSVLRGLVDRLLPGGRMLEQSVMFPAPTFADEPVHFSAELRHVESSEVELSLEVRRVNDDEITCQGHCRVAP